KTTVFRFCIPSVAGFLIITFPTSSSMVCRPRLFPKSSINRITRSSFLDALGTTFRSANLFQTLVGSNFRIFLFICRYLLFFNGHTCPTTGGPAPLHRSGGCNSHRYIRICPPEGIFLFLAGDQFSVMLISYHKIPFPKITDRKTTMREYWLLLV